MFSSNDMDDITNKISTLKIKVKPTVVQCFQAFEKSVCAKCAVFKWTNRKKLCFVCALTSE